MKKPFPLEREHLVQVAVLLKFIWWKDFDNAGCAAGGNNNNNNNYKDTIQNFNLRAVDSCGRY